MARHVEKVGRADAEEHHIFVSLGPGSVPDGLYIALMDEPTTLPTSGPKVPKPLTHLWLTPVYGQHLLEWSRASGWSVHNVFG